MFPANRGFVSSLFVGGWIGSSIVFEIVRAMYHALGRDQAAFRASILGLVALSILWAALMLWMAPPRPFVDGDSYHCKGLRFAIESEQQRAARKLKQSTDTSGWPAQTAAAPVGKQSHGSGNQLMVVTHHSSDCGDSRMSRDSLPTRSNSVATSTQSTRAPKLARVSAAARKAAEGGKGAQAGARHRDKGEGACIGERTAISDSASSRQADACAVQADAASACDASRVSQAYTELCSSITLAHDLPASQVGTQLWSSITLAHDLPEEHSGLQQAGAANSDSLVSDALVCSPPHVERAEMPHDNGTAHEASASKRRGFARLPLCSRWHNADGSRRTRPAHDRCAGSRITRLSSTSRKLACISREQRALLLCGSATTPQL